MGGRRGEVQVLHTPLIIHYITLSHPVSPPLSFLLPPSLSLIVIIVLTTLREKGRGPSIKHTTNHTLHNSLSPSLSLSLFPPPSLSLPHRHHRLYDVMNHSSSPHHNQYHYDRLHQLWESFIPSTPSSVP